MLYNTPALLDALNSVTAIPIVPYRQGQIDYTGHARNVEYLMRANRLDGGRPRVIAIAGTSLIHHIEVADQARLIAETGTVMGKQGVLMAAIVPNPIGSAKKLIESLLGLPRTPDVFLVMPLTGVMNPEGLYQEYMQLGQRYGSEMGARFLYYLRNSSERPIVTRLINDSPHWVGVKVGTTENDVLPLIDGVGDNGMVIWGVGDRCTKAAELGTKGHTSGIAVVYAGASDAINNAQRRGDFATSQEIEGHIQALEDLRFMEGRMYNYSAVTEAMHLSGFADIVGGEGGPFNPPVPALVREQVMKAIEGLAQYH